MNRDIAVIGLAGRFPGADTIKEFWSNLITGVESIKDLDDQALLEAGASREEIAHDNYVKRCSYIDNIEYFDAAFFNLSPREAEMMDPHHRQFFECAWHALEDAGYDPDTTSMTIGCFAGSGLNGYLLHNMVSQPNQQIGPGVEKDYIATGTAFKLNLKGPCVNVQSFCSTSLVAIHLACQSLLQDECDMALAGGSSAKVPQKLGYLYQPGNIFSADGHVRAFDAGANGTVFGDGVGAVLLKRLAQAERDGDRIYAVVKASAVNNDGAKKASFTAPTVDGQARVIRQALDKAGIAPSEVSYIEAHGTATAMGDPIEIAALTKAYGTQDQCGEENRNNSCALGSVKTNIGHVDAAAGVAGFIKTVLSVHHSVIPASLNYHQPNPLIDFNKTPFYVNTTTRPWENPKRIAGVSGFGIGGTNAHIVVSANHGRHPRSTGYPSPCRLWNFLPVSAKSSASLEAAKIQLLAHVASLPPTNHSTDLSDVAYTLQRRRKAFHFRDALLINTGKQNTPTSLPDHLGTWLNETPTTPIAGVPSLAFIFAGEGTERKALGKQLYQQEPVFKKIVDLCCDDYQTHFHQDLKSVIWADEPLNGFPKGTAIPQLRLLIVEYALARLYLSWGITPTIVLGHGIGEFAAAMIAGVFSPLDALRLVVACEQHQPSVLADMALRTPQFPLLSNRTGQLISDAQATDPNYWARHLQHPLRFDAAVTHLLSDPSSVLLIVGPNQVVTTSKPENSADSKQTVISTLSIGNSPSEDADTDACHDITRALCRLWLAGVEIDWHAFYQDEQRTVVTLPGYAFDRKKYWLEKRQNGDAEATLIQKLPVHQWFNQMDWLKSASISQQTDSAEKKHWLVFADDMGISEQLQPYFNAHGNRVVVVTRGDRFSAWNDNRYCINPNDATDYHALLEGMTQNKTPIDRIAYFWSADTKMTPPDAHEVDTTLFFSLLYLAQGIGKYLHDTAIELFVITRGCQQVSGTEVQMPASALVTGPVKVIPQEFPQVSTRLLDIEIDDSVTNTPHLIQHLVNELFASSDLFAEELNSTIAFRGNYRWQQVFKPMQIAMHADATSHARVKEKGVYLITGGMGGIGLAIAKMLAQRYRAKLCLLGRTELPPQDAWERWLQTHQDDDASVATYQKVQCLMELKKLGADLLLLSADVTQAESVTEALNHIQARFGELHGVIHAAGVAGGGVIQLKTKAAAEQVMSAKVNGTLNLTRQILSPKRPAFNQSLDFIVCFSSLTALAGEFGQVDYTSANAFLDCFCREEQRLGKPLFCLNWDGWQDVGMNATAAKNTSLEDVRTDSLSLAITPEEGTRVFEAFLDSGNPHAIISTHALLARFSQIFAMTQKPHGAMQSVAVNAPLSSRPQHPRPDAMLAEYIAPRNKTEEKIAHIWQQFIGVTPVGIADNFFDLGGDSVMGLQVIDSLNRTFKANIPVVCLFEGSTIESLSAMIEPPKTAQPDMIAASNERGKKRRQRIKQRRLR